MEKRLLCVFVLFLCIVLSSCSSSERELKAAYDRGYEAGFDEGSRSNDYPSFITPAEDDSYSSYDEGYEDGYEHGYENGKQDTGDAIRAELSEYTIDDFLNLCCSYTGERIHVLETMSANDVIEYYWDKGLNLYTLDMIKNDFDEILLELQEMDN